MSALEWDKENERLYETGTSDVALYVKNATGGGYGTGVAWNGCTGVSEAPEGAEPTDLYADNIKYLTMRSKETLKATITAYTYPDEFEICDGTATLIKGMSIGQQTRRGFGLVYKTKVGNDTEGDDYGYKLHFLYGCTASPSSKDYKTINDSPEAIEFSWELTTSDEVVGNIGGVDYKPTSTVTIKSADFIDKSSGTVDPNFTKLLEYVYGSDTLDPKMPTIPEIYEILKTGELPDASNAIAG